MSIVVCCPGCQRTLRMPVAPAKKAPAFNPEDTPRPKRTSAPQPAPAKQAAVAVPRPQPAAPPVREEPTRRTPYRPPAETARPTQQSDRDDDEDSIVPAWI